MADGPRTQADALQTAHRLHQAGRLDEADQAYRKAARQRRNRLPALFGLGTLELQRGRPHEAVRHLQQAARLAPSRSDIAGNLGHALLASGDVSAAIGQFERACALAPDDAGGWFNLGYALQAETRVFEAARAYRRATELAPDDPAAHNNLAGMLQEMGRAAAAAEQYRAALARRPGDAGIAFNLCLALESANQTDAARDQAAALHRANPADPRWWYLLARLDRRGGDPEGARDRLAAALERNPDADLEASIHKDLGLLLDRQGRYDEAFAATARGNALRRASARQRGFDARRWRRRIAGYRDRIDAALLRRWAGRPPVQDGQAPAFFVGFPRSGTTLVETLLAAHPALFTSGEHSPLDYVTRQLAGGDGDVPGNVAALTPEALDRLRGDFRRAADGLFGDFAGGRRLVDKLPFSIVELGLINGLFPDCQAIVALRDPRDVVLSCLMQDFALNDAMAGLLDVAETAGLYAETIGLWLHYRQVLTIPALAYRYEDLVTDPAATGERLIRFLGLDWDPALLARRGQDSAFHVATPSREAVLQPINTRAVGRWRQYARHLAPALPILQPLLEPLGYAGD